MRLEAQAGALMISSQADLRRHLCSAQKMTTPGEVTEKWPSLAGNLPIAVENAPCLHQFEQFYCRAQNHSLLALDPKKKAPS